MNRALQTLIHVGCKELGIDADARRALQVAVTGKGSMKDMTEADLKLVIDRLKADGFRVTRSDRERPAAKRADVRLIHVLWRKLGDAGQLKRPGRDGLNAFIRSRFEKTWSAVPADVDMMQDGQQIEQVVRALKDWGKRAEIDFDWGQHRQ